jgi:hypothetical protein
MVAMSNQAILVGAILLRLIGCAAIKTPSPPAARRVRFYGATSRMV